MSGKVYLTRAELAAVKKALAAAGFQEMADDVWTRLGPIHGPWKVDLQDLFPSPFTVPEAWEARRPCVGCDRTVAGPYPCPHCGFRHTDSEAPGRASDAPGPNDQP